MALLQTNRLVGHRRPITIFPLSFRSLGRMMGIFLSSSNLPFLQVTQSLQQLIFLLPFQFKLMDRLLCPFTDPSQLFLDGTKLFPKFRVFFRFFAQHRFKLYHLLAGLQ